MSRLVAKNEQFPGKVEVEDLQGVLAPERGRKSIYPEKQI